MPQRITSKKSIAIGTTVMGIIALTGAIVMWRFGADANAVPAPETTVRPVKTVQLRAMSKTETRSFPGLVRAASETELAFRSVAP